MSERSSIPSSTQTPLAAVLLELLPPAALVLVIGTVLLPAISQWAALIGVVPFAVSGLGWFYIREFRWGLAIFGGRLVIVVAGLAMLSAAIASGHCESSECVRGSRGPSAAFAWATVVVCLVALLSPVASAIAVARWRPDPADP